MNMNDATRVVTEDLHRMKLEYLYLLWHLCNLVIRCLKRRTPAELLDLQAIAEAELAKRRMAGVD